MFEKIWSWHYWTWIKWPFGFMLLYIILFNIWCLETVPNYDQIVLMKLFSNLKYLYNFLYYLFR